jgi:multidrug efflux system outer membrane protein
MLRLALAGGALGLLAGCAVGPDYARPDLASDVPARWRAGPAATDTATPPVVAPAAAARDSLPALDRWWAAFGDSTLDRLVDRALAGNQDLAAASARVLEARATLGGARADRWPALEIGGTVNRSKSSLQAFGGRGSFYRSQFDANLSTRYELDLWGRLSRAEEAARAGLLQDVMNRRVVVQTLVADVVRTWLQVRELQCQLGLALRTRATYEQTLQTVQDRYVRGVAPALDLRLARQNLRNTEATIPQTRQQLAEAVRRLEILLGEYPAGAVVQLDDAQLRALAMPDPLPAVPAGLPSSLLERRPDLIAAEAGLHAAVANVGVAKARLYPTLTLTGSAGYTSGELDQLFQSGNDIWSLVGDVVMPLINRGATTAQVRAAEARAEQAVASYRQTVLGAFAEVENALDAERHQAAREAALTASVREARRSLDLARQRYRAGLDNLLSTLETQRRLLNAESALLATQRAFRTARVNLILALGGPWDAELAPDLLAATRGATAGGDRP